MQGLWSDHFPAADKPTTSADISPCREKGLWSEHISSADKPEGSASPPLARHQRCLICPMCNATSCRLFTSSTPKNPGQQFYRCSGPDHNFFKWADEVKPDELIDVPNCGDCTAGVCRVRRETSGPNAGRILFMCRAKEGPSPDHFPAAGKPATTADISPSKGKGLWSEHFPCADKPEESASPPLARYQRCLICPMCNAASCRLFTSSTPKNPGRQFYKCSGPDHNFFKWADEVKPDELINVPNCGGCTAGVCRVRRETSGPNAGRILFMCRVKEGQGSCGYRVWQDKLEMPAAGRADERISSSQPCTINCNDTSATTADLVEESMQADERADTASPVIDTKEHLQCREVTSRKLAQLKCQEDKTNESSRRPQKRSRFADIKASGSLISAQSLTIRVALNSLPITRCWIEDAIRENLSTQLRGWWGRLAFHPMPCLMTYASKLFTYSVTSHLECTFVVQDILVNTTDSTALTRNHQGVESYRKSHFNLETSHNALDSTAAVQDKILVISSDSNSLTGSFLGTESYSKAIHDQGHCHNAEVSSIVAPSRVALDVPSCSDPFRKIKRENVMSKSISNAFSQAAECLQNDLLALLETMDVKDHEDMSQAAEATFAALDRLLSGNQDFKKRVKELIHCASLLAEIEQSMPTHDSYQKLIEHCSNERARLDEINCVHAKAIDAVTNNKKRLKVLQEEISSTMDWLFQIEAEVSCREVEMRNMERDLEQISKNKEVLEGKYVIASKEMEESQKLLEQKEAERIAAKAAFNRARALLRG